MCIQADSDASFPVEYKTISIEGVGIFYREAGPKDAPVLIMLHGFPSSSRMFATLMPRLADKYHLIAPDYPGFGHSDRPDPETFSYTFDHLAECIDKFTEQLGLSRYSLYLQDYGGPIGFRLAAAQPERITALIIQNAVVHIQGLSEAWDVRKAFWRDRAAYEEKLRQALLSPEVARQRHLGNVPVPARVDPDTWTEEFLHLTRTGMDRIQLDLMFDYQTNIESYPRWQEYLRSHRPPTLIVWGKCDPLFTVAGAIAFGEEVPDAEIHLLNAGHFALDTEADVIAMLIRRFLQKKHIAETILRSTDPEKPTQIPITGKEVTNDPHSPIAALEQFYHAFNSRDIREMAENWEQSSSISMDNPLGGIKRGWEDIRGVYENIFHGPARVEVEFYDYTIHEFQDTFLAVGRERGEFEKDGHRMELAIRTSRIFKRHTDGWKQIHHHGSIDDPKLLERYQRAVLGK